MAKCGFGDDAQDLSTGLVDLYLYSVHATSSMAAQCSINRNPPGRDCTLPIYGLLEVVLTIIYSSEDVLEEKMFGWR